MSPAATSVEDRCQAALLDRLATTLPASVVDRFVGGTHTQRLADNLLPGFTQAQIAALRGQLIQGAGGELRPSSGGKRPAHAPHSSAALAINAFGPWVGHERALRIAELDGCGGPLLIEHKLKISHNGGTANLDAWLPGEDRVIGIESKLTEMLKPKPPTWSQVYSTAAMATLLDGGWAQALAEVLGDQQATHLRRDQLIKHALAIQSHYPDDETHLVYCYWEPTDANVLDEFEAHRLEVKRFAALVGDSRPRFHAVSYVELWQEWEQRPGHPWIADHLAQLRSRYVVGVG